GREAIKYLPFASTATGAAKNDGSFKLDPYTQQVDFYNARLSGDIGETGVGINGLNWAYSKTNFEPSPLNRVDNTYAPGVDWVGTEAMSSEAERHNVRIQYYSNTTTDDVKIWTVTNGAGLGDWGSYAVTGAYNAGELYKTITIDEHDKQVIEFKDKEGKVILKKVQTDDATADDGTGTGYADWICTYYIYDDLGNLRCVIQPVGVSSLSATSWNLTEALINEVCFCYEYDGRNRMIMKKVPGVAPAYAVYMVYDARDRLVMTQDGKQRTGSPQIWLINHYDELNRLIQTGFVSTSYPAFVGKTFVDHLNAAAVSTSYPFTPATAPSITYYARLTQTGYDDYDGMDPAETRFTKELDETYTTGEYLHTAYNTAPLYAQQ